MANILAADSSTKNVSCALVTETGIREISYTGTKSVSATILDQSDFLLHQAGINRDALDCLALGSGPGSFTGMRVSFSLFKAIADALDRPLVCVDSLDIIASPYLHNPASVAVFQRARKGFAYFALYSKGTRCGENLYLNPQECAQKAKSLPEGSIITGDACDGFFEVPDRGFFTCNCEGSPSAGWLCRLALKKYENKEITHFDQALPEYMRPSDAEEKADN